LIARGAGLVLVAALPAALAALLEGEENGVGMRRGPLELQHLENGRIELAGGAYLVWLGVDALRKRRAHAEAMTTPDAPRPSTRRAIAEGFVVGVANPKAIVFFIAVTLYISIRFEFKMAVAAIIAVIHDILIVIGIYSLGRFEVTPDTVVAVLTVLGYSLYDTVVVFDRIRENAKGLGASGRITYSEMVNLSMNQTLARSINTSLVAIVPVLSVLLVGSYLLGATTLESFGLALVIGLTSGAYSSIFIAAPLLDYLGVKRETVGQAVRAKEAAAVKAKEPSPAKAKAASRQT